MQVTGGTGKHGAQAAAPQKEKGEQASSCHHACSSAQEMHQQCLEVPYWVEVSLTKRSCYVFYILFVFFVRSTVLTPVNTIRKHMRLSMFML